MPIGRLLLLLALIWPAALMAAKALPLAPEPLVPALWEVSDGKKSMMLFGTVHALPRGVDWFRPHVAAALDGSTQLVLETRIPDSPASLMPVMMRLARLQAARPLPDRLPESWRPLLDRALERLKPGPLDWYDTWFVALTLSNLQSVENGFDPRIGVEAVLAERARMRSIPVNALESTEEQLINFDSLPEADQQRLLMSVLEGLDSSKPDMDRLIAEWMAGDIDALAKRVNKDFDRSPMLRRLLVEDRNARWAAWIARQLREGPGGQFLAVGAGHMAGPGSLMADLERYGLKVTRVMPEPPKRKRRR